MELRQEGLVEAYTEVYVEGAEGIRTVPLNIKGVGLSPRKAANETPSP